MAKIKYRYPLEYRGNILIFVVCTILFLPLGIVLAIKNMGILQGKKYLCLSYRGSFGWLIFWTLLFFPVAIILISLNGIDVIEEG